MKDALRIILPLYLLAFFVIAFAWRSYVVYKRTGINPYASGRSDRVIDFVQGFYAIPMLLLLATTLIFAFLPGVYVFATPIVWLESLIVQIIGLVLMTLALVWVATAQANMGRSWRIGIDDKNEAELVETGLFTVSRNPIFLGVRVAVFGSFLVLPNAVTLVALVLGDVLMQIQVRLEEEFLTKVHGEKYIEFQKRVRRWI